MWNTMWRKRKTRCFRKYVSTATRPVWIGLAISWNRPRESNTGRRAEFAGKYNFSKVDWYSSAKGGERKQWQNRSALTRTVIAPLMMAGASPEEMKRSAAVTALKPGRAVQTSVSAVTRTVLDYRRCSGARVLQA